MINALFIDSVHAPGSNFKKVLEFVTAGTVKLHPLTGGSLSEGSYH
jgi:hypothetical protein